MSDKDKEDTVKAVLTGVGIAMGICNPDLKWHWKEPEGYDFDSMSNEESQFVESIRRDQWASSCAAIIGTLEMRYGKSNIDVELFKASIAHGRKLGKEKDNG